MRNGLLIDYEFCTGCQSCEIACKQEHGFGTGKWGIRVLDEGPWEIDEKTVNWNKIPTPTSLCDLCAERTAGRKTADLRAPLPRRRHEVWAYRSARRGA